MGNALSALRSSSMPHRYGVALLMVALATIGQYITSAYLHDRNIYTVYWLCVITSALYGGLGPGLLALFLSGFLAEYMYVAPHHSLIPQSPSGYTAMGAYFVVGAVMCLLCEKRRHADADRRVLLQNAQETNLTLAGTLSALTSSEARLRGIFDQAAVGIAHVDLQGRWLHVNQRLCDIVGYTADELLSTSFQEITHPDDLAADLHYVQSLLTGSLDTYTTEKRYLHKDGTPIWINLSVSLVRDENSKPDFFIAVIENIEQRKQAEEEVHKLTETLELRVEERTRQLEEANTELEAFSYSISHDLRAPLRGMQGYSRALEEDYGETLDGTAKQHLARIVRAAEQMDTLINDLLNYSRLSRADIDLGPVFLEGVVRDALAQSGLQDRAKIDVRPPLHPLIANKIILLQVLVNLLSNAVKFVAPGVTPTIELWTEQHEDRTRICVRDNGIGIEPEHYERIFRVFERLHGEETYPGTGIGLAIVKKGVECMGGVLGILPASEGGSIFWMEFPACPKERCA